jgi:hypothetical protein
MNLNTGQPWSELDLWDLQNSLALDDTAAEVADFLCRDEDEVRDKMIELGLEEGDNTAAKPKDEPSEKASNDSTQS